VVDLPIDQVFLTRKNTKVIRLGRNLAVKNAENTKGFSSKTLRTLSSLRLNN
jgi:hypothetical protein